MSGAIEIITKSANDICIHTSLCILRPLSKKDITPQYIERLNDPNFNRYLEARHEVQTLDTVQAWVSSYNADPSRLLFGIFRNEEHIGNATIYAIDNQHKCMRVGISVGKKDFRSQGCGRLALMSLAKYGFEEMEMNRVEAGIYQHNLVAVNMFYKAGFHLEAVFKNRIIFEGEFIDMYLLVQLKEDFLKQANE